LLVPGSYPCGQHSNGAPSSLCAAAIRPPRQQPFKARPSHGQRQRDGIVASEGEDIEGVELHFVIAPAGMQRIEIRNAIDPRMTASQLLLSDPASGLDNPGIAFGPVIAVSGNQPYPIALALRAQAVAVIFDFVDPVGPVGKRGAGYG
jgi:hypothetical protein